MNRRCKISVYVNRSDLWDYTYCNKCLNMLCFSPHVDVSTKIVTYHVTSPHMTHQTEISSQHQKCCPLKILLMKKCKQEQLVHPSIHLCRADCWWFLRFHFQLHVTFLMREAQKRLPVHPLARQSVCHTFLQICNTYVTIFTGGGWGTSCPAHFKSPFNTRK